MGRNWAIAIGINQYHNLQPLHFAKDDAEQIRQFFLSTAGFEQVYLFSDDSPAIAQDYGPPIASQPTYATLRRFLRVRFEQPFLKSGDNFWFFFAGHGIRHEDRDYLMPLDADPGDIDDTAIPLSYVAERLSRCGADNVVLLIDACRSQGRRDGLGIGTELQQGVITIFSCSPQESSYEIEALKQGAFTHSLLHAMQIQGEGNCATVERLYQYLRHQVPLVNQQYSKPLQTPYAVVEPATKYHLILLPRFATVRDAETLKLDAFKAEHAKEYTLAEQLWLRVLIVSPADPDAIDGIRRIDRMRTQPPQSSSSTSTEPLGDRRPNLPQQSRSSTSHRLQPPVSPHPQLQSRPKATPSHRSISPIPQRSTQSLSGKEQAKPPDSTPLPRPPLRWPSVSISRRRLLQISGGLGASMGAIALGRVFWPNSDSQTSESDDAFPEAASSPELNLTAEQITTVQVNEQGEETGERSVEVNVFDEDLGDDIALRMVEIPGGEFWMGQTDPETEELTRPIGDDKYRECYKRELPRHPVSVPSFFMGMFTITQAQYEAVMGSNPATQYDSRFVAPNKSVVGVSWENAIAFCEQLSQQTGREYRLPSEAEWEYACRAKTETPFHFGDTITPNLANYRGIDWEWEGTMYPGGYGKGPTGIFRVEPMSVGSFPANAFGLFDMHENVFEWCLDHWHVTYQGAPTDGRAWIEDGDSNQRMLRGGSWDDVPGRCRSAFRYKSFFSDRSFAIGFRVICSAPRTLA